MAETITRSKTFPDILFIERPTFSDERGFFHEYVRLDELEAAVGRPVRFVQANHSRSIQRVMRGIHAATYDKLVYVLTGKVWTALVDLRPDSRTFGQHEVISLGDESRQTLFLPGGFGNSYYVQSPSVEYTYQVGEYFEPGKELTIRWDDPDLAIDWPDKHPLISERDRNAQTVRQAFPQKFK